jgi:hypothetical protein
MAANTTRLDTGIVGYQARTAGGEVLGEIQGVSPRGLRLHKIPGQLKRAGHIPAEAVASIDSATDTISVREGIGLEQLISSPAPPADGPDRWHMSDDWWADLLGHYGLYDAEGKSSEPFLHPDQK